MNSQLPVGIFDSGVGGLTVLRALREALPDESFIYLGDTARLPYGTKSAASVQRYAAHAASYLVEQGIKMLVVACNTATALALDDLRAQLAPLPVIGVVEPGAAAAVAGSRNHRHLVLATEATVGHHAYAQAIHELDSEAQVEEMACSLFVALAEEGWHDGAEAEAVAARYLADVPARPEAERPDAAILGCTHFPLLKPVIERVLGPHIRIVDSATTTAEVAARTLAAEGLLGSGGGGLRLVATDSAARFAEVGGAFLGAPLSADDVEIVDIHPSDHSRARSGQIDSGIA